MPLAGRGGARTRLYLEPAAKTERESERESPELSPPSERSFAAQLAHRRGGKLKASTFSWSIVIVCLLRELLRTDVREGILFV